MTKLIIFVFMIAALITPAFATNSTTIGNTTFDFDAPSPPVTAAQQQFFQKYKDAVNTHSEAALMALQDPSLKGCIATSSKLLLQDLSRTIADNAQVRFFNASEDLAKEMGMADLAYLSAQPTAILGIDSRTMSNNTIKMVTIFRPVRQTGDSYTLIPYCLTEQGKAVLEQKSQPPNAEKSR